MYDMIIYIMVINKMTEILLWKAYFIGLSIFVELKIKEICPRLMKNSSNNEAGMLMYQGSTMCMQTSIPKSVMF